MADVKISQLPAATLPVVGTEILPVVQGGVTSRVTINAATGITRPFTANGVMYASSTTALATGSGLQFDGSNLGLGVTPSAWSGKVLELGVAGNALASIGTNQFWMSANAIFNSGTGWKYGATGVATVYQQQNGAHLWFNAPSGTAGNAISFTQAATLTADGDYLVGKTSGATNVGTYGCSLTAVGAAYFARNGNPALYVARGTSNGNAVEFYVGTTQSGYINITSGGTPAFAAASDVRLKDNIVEHESELSNLMSLRPVRWNWKNLDGKSGEGFIAQELENTAWADLVSEGENGYKQISGLGVVETRLIKAIQELKAEFDAYKAAHP